MAGETISHVYSSTFPDIEGVEAVYDAITTAAIEDNKNDTDTAATTATGTTSKSPAKVPKNPYFWIAKEAINEAVSNSMIIDEMNVEMLPKFDYDELGLGEKIGQGGFADIYEIQSITLLPRKNTTIADLDYSDSDSDDNENSQEHSREYLSYTCLQNNMNALASSYALKCIRKDIVENEEVYPSAIADIVNETYFLSSFNHPHISKILGIVQWKKESTEHNTISGQNAGFMIISNRLYSFLDGKMEEWKQKSKSLLNRLGLNKDILRQQVKVAYDLGCVFQYLHSINIMCRDIKPENIGFDMKGELKIFDFGLSTELLPEERNANGLYLLSMAGTHQYMAPEVIKEDLYNELADVYSYGIVMWECFMLEKAFLGWSYADLFANAHGSSFKLKFSSSAPAFVPPLIQHCCAHDWRDRPSFDTLTKTTLKVEYNKVKGEHEGVTNKHGSLRSFSFAKKLDNAKAKTKNNNSFRLPFPK